MKYSTQNLMTIMLSLMLSACGSGSSGGGGVSSSGGQGNASNKSTILSNWSTLNAQNNTDYIDTISGSNGIVFDNATQTLYNYNGSTICQLNANVSVNTQWNCNILLPLQFAQNFYSALFSDNNGHLYFINDRSNLLIYDILRGIWTQKALTTSVYPGSYRNSVVVDNNVGYMVANNNDLISISLGTGKVTTVSNFFNPSAGSTISIDQQGNIYYQADGVGPIYSKNISGVNDAHQVGVRPPEFIIPSNIVTANGRLFICGSLTEYSIPTNADYLTKWDVLNKIVNDTDLSNQGGCEAMTLGNGFIYAYNEYTYVNTTTSTSVYSSNRTVKAKVN